MRDFTFQISPMRVVFGAGSRSRLLAELERLGVKRVLLIAGPGQGQTAEDVGRQLGRRCVARYDRVVPHVPVEIAEAARAKAQEVEADCCLTIGGGSATGLGKAIALTAALPLVAVPTTYSGSEMTPIWGLTEGQNKQTGRNPRVQPRVVIYDPELLVSLPPEMAGPSGMNAIAHCVEALYAPNANPVISLLAEEGLRALATGLPTIMERPGDIDVQAQVLYGAWLGGAALASVGMGLHHKLCHVLGGTFDTPHAETHAVILPHVTGFNIPAAPEARRRIASALGTAAVASALQKLGERLRAPRSLAMLGLQAADLDRAADLAVQAPYENPRPVTREDVRRLLEDAYRGVVPEP